MRKREMTLLEKTVRARFVEMFGGVHDSRLYPYTTVESFTTVKSGGTPEREIQEYWQGGNIRWVKTTELQNCVITDTEEKITQLAMDNSSAKLIPADSVLIAMYGQGKTRGMTGYLATDSTTNQACACILPSGAVNQKYLWKYMILSYDKLRGMAKGGNQPNLNTGIIKRFPILMPPLELQNQFAAFVEQVDKSKVAVQKALDETQIDNQIFCLMM
jgi:type I restriction enzyme S subunit